MTVIINKGSYLFNVCVHSSYCKAKINNNKLKQM